MNASDRRAYAAVLERASLNGWPECEECHTSAGPFQMHHVVFRSHGGGNTLSNVKLLCLT